MVLYNAGCVFLLTRNPDKAFECLERAVGLGFAHWGWFEQDSNLDPLRDLPRYRALIARRP